MSVEREVGIFEAKTHLSELIGEVEAGANLTLTRRGVPVARLVPIRSREKRSAAIEGLARIGARLRAADGALTLPELQQYRDEGRR